MIILVRHPTDRNEAQDTGLANQSRSFVILSIICLVRPAERVYLLVTGVEYNPHVSQVTVKFEPFPFSRFKIIIISCFNLGTRHYLSPRARRNEKNEGISHISPPFSFSLKKGKEGSLT